MYASALTWTLLVLCISSMHISGLVSDNQPTRRGQEFFFGWMLLPGNMMVDITIVNTNAVAVNISIAGMSHGIVTEIMHVQVLHNSALVVRNHDLLAPACIERGTKICSIRMTSDLPIAAYVRQGTNGPSIDVLLLLPKDKLGTEYLLSTPGSNNRRPRQFAVIVATANATEVIVKLANGTSLPTQILNELEAVALPTDTDRWILNAALVSASKPVAVVAGHLSRPIKFPWYTTRGWIFEAEMMLPLSSLSEHYVLVPFLPSEAKTYVEITMPIDTTFNTTDALRVVQSSDINADESADCNRSASGYCVRYFEVLKATYLTANRKVMLSLFGEAHPMRDIMPPLVLLPPITDFCASPIGFYPPVGRSHHSKHYLLLIAYSNNIAGLRLDGNKIDTTWTEVTQEGARNISFTHLNVNDGYHTLHNADADNQTAFIVIAYGREGDSSYAFILSVNRPCDTADPQCVMNSTRKGPCEYQDPCKPGQRLVQYEPTNPSSSCVATNVSENCDVDSTLCTVSEPSRRTLLPDSTQSTMQSSTNASISHAAKTSMNDRTVAIVVNVLGGFTLIAFFAVVLILCYRHRKNKPLPATHKWTSTDQGTDTKDQANQTQEQNSESSNKLLRTQKRSLMVSDAVYSSRSHCSLR